MIQRQTPTPNRPESFDQGLGALFSAAGRSAATHATAADSTRRLSPETVALLTEAGFARHFVPRAWGGTEGTFTDLLAAVAALGEACTSAAWCAALWATHGRYAACLPPEGQREVWESSPDVRIAASIQPAGDARRLPAGWLLSGEWACVSGVEHADWLLLAAMAPREADGTGDAAMRCRFFAVPASEVTVRDTWQSTGLRGTGSHTAVVESAFVPDHRTCLMADALSGTPGIDRASCHTVPAQLVGGLLFCAPALGAARRALADWSLWAAPKAARTGPDDDGRRLDHALARTADDIETAQLLLEDAARRADSGTRAEAAVVKNRRLAAAAAELLVDSVERLFRAAGVHACGAPGALERRWRDVHTVAAHHVLRREAAAVAYAASVFTAMAAEGAVAPGARSGGQPETVLEGARR